MTEAWNGCVIICPHCESEDIIYIDDEYHSCDNYEIYQCKDCGKVIYITLPS